MSEMSFPARITSYKVFYTENKAQLKLFGVDEHLEHKKEIEYEAQSIANIDFVPLQEKAIPTFKAFINRGGFLQATRPLWLLSSILVLLEKGGDIQIDGNGNLSKTGKITEAAS